MGDTAQPPPPPLHPALTSACCSSCPCVCSGAGRELSWEPSTTPRVVQAPRLGDAGCWPGAAPGALGSASCKAPGTAACQPAASAPGPALRRCRAVGLKAPGSHLGCKCNRARSRDGVVVPLALPHAVGARAMHSPVDQVRGVLAWHQGSQLQPLQHSMAARAVTPRPP